MGYADSNTRKLLIEQNREAIAQIREFLAGSREERQRFRRWKIPAEFFPGEKIMVRVRSEDSERGLDISVRPEVGSVMHLDGQEWIVTSVTEIYSHGYGTFAKGCGTLGILLALLSSPAPAPHPVFEMAQVCLPGPAGVLMLLFPPALTGVPVEVIHHRAQAAVFA